MTRDELELHTEQLEELLDAIATVVDDRDISDAAAREQLRELLEEDDDER